MDKTKITNIRKRHITFLGFDYKKVKGKGKFGWISRSKPNNEKFLNKIKEIRKDIYIIRKRETIEKKINDLIIVNSKIRGILNYYKIATWIGTEAKKYSRMLSYAGWNSLAPIGAKWIPANQVDNLRSVHEKYKTAIPTIEYGENKVKIGLTNLSFIRWDHAKLKRNKETLYSEEGRQIYFNRTQKKQPLHRADELLKFRLSHAIAYANRISSKAKYNFEYMMNSCYAFNRDKGKCRICKEFLLPEETHTHHIYPKLPLEKVNRVVNLASVHKHCHKLIHGTTDLSVLEGNIKKNVQMFREKLKK